MNIVVKKITFFIVYTFILANVFSQNVFNVKIPGDNYRNFILTKDSGFIIYDAEPLLNKDGIIYKINKYGKLTDSILNPKIETASKNKILYSKDGFVLAGETDINHIEDGEGIDFIFEKVSFEGEIIWKLPLEGVFFIDAINTSDGHFLMLGEIFEQHDFGMADVVLYKVNEAGELLWKKIIGNKFVGVYDYSYFEYGTSVTEIDQNYYVSYENAYKNLTTDSKLVKIDNKGNTLWTIKDEFNTKKLKSIISTFKLNNKFYYVNSDNNKLIEFNDITGKYSLTDKNIGVINVGFDYYNYNIRCNELAVVENNIFYKYTSLDTPLVSNKLPVNLIRDMIKTYDGGYAILYIDGTIIKTDCYGNTDFWDEACTYRLKENNILVYPNPTRQELNVEASFNIKKITVLNQLGKAINYYNFCNCGKQKIDVLNLTSGTYFLKIVGKNEYEIAKFIKY